MPIYDEFEPDLPSTMPDHLRNKGGNYKDLPKKEISSLALAK